MNKLKILAVAMIAGWLALSGSVLADTGAGTPEMRINVGLTDSQAARKVVRVVRQYGGRLLSEIPQLNVLTFSVPETVVLTIKDRLVFGQLAAFVEEDRQRRICLREFTEVDIPESNGQVVYYPNDPSYTQQWGPECIGAENAWDVELGEESVIVAVVDTGVDLDHPDLANNVDTGIDWDFVNEDDDAMDDNGHGTHVAGIIAAEINNSIGVAGLQQVTIMAVKGLDSSGSGWTSVLANCIVYAVDNGARVINCSWGGYGADTVLKNATEYAFAEGVIVVAAAGNDGRSLSFYPAAYPKVAGVAALTNCTTRAAWSNYGFNNVKIAAPGDAIFSTWRNDSYAYASGTSMASPHVAGVVAAYLSYAPGLTHIQIIYHMAYNVDDLGTPGNDQYYGFGRVDMYPFD